MLGHPKMLDHLYYNKAKETTWIEKFKVFSKAYSKTRI